MLHGNMVPGSAGNITLHPRKFAHLTLNAVSDYIRKPTRSEWVALQEFAAMKRAAGDVLLVQAQRVPRRLSRRHLRVSRSWSGPGRSRQS